MKTTIIPVLKNSELKHLKTQFYKIKKKKKIEGTIGLTSIISKHEYAPPAKEERGFVDFHHLQSFEERMMSS